MQFYDVVEKRTSIKKFKGTTLEKDKLSRIINAAMMSPSWRNNSSYKFILVNDKNEREALAETVKNDSPDASDAIIDAPLTAIIVADPNKSGQINGKDYSLVDSAIAMEHLILAATNEGYGTCWIGAFDENKVRGCLNIPDTFNVIGMTPIGEIAEDKKHYAKKDVGDYVFINKWDSPYSSNIKM